MGRHVTAAAFFSPMLTATGVSRGRPAGVILRPVGLTLSGGSLRMPAYVLHLSRLVRTWSPHWSRAVVDFRQPRRCRIQLLDLAAARTRLPAMDDPLLLVHVVRGRRGQRRRMDLRRTRGCARRPFVPLAPGEGDV